MLTGYRCPQCQSAWEVKGSPERPGKLPPVPDSVRDAYSRDDAFGRCPNCGAELLAVEQSEGRKSAFS
jgi:ssDNA-binding Zn-finger/Zn-ribbon topoisomerase 1